MGDDEKEDEEKVEEEEEELGIVLLFYIFLMNDQIPQRILSNLKEEIPHSCKRRSCKREIQSTITDVISIV